MAKEGAVEGAVEEVKVEAEVEAEAEVEVGVISKRSFCFISLEMLNLSISSIFKTEKHLLIQELMS